MYIPEKMAAAYAEQMAKPDLVFVTQANEEKMSQQLAERRATCVHDWESITTPAVGKNPEVTHAICKLCLIDKAQWDAALVAVGAKNG